MEFVPDNFLGLEEEFSRYDTARFVVLPIPYDSTTSYRPGTRNGPRAIIEASQQVELYDEEFGNEFYQVGIHTAEPLFPEMAGPEAMHNAIYEAAKSFVADGKFVLGIGGEHSVSSGLIRAAAEKGGSFSILHFDAHLDLRDQYQGTPWSHASVMRRALDHADNIVSFGIRNICAEEAEFCKSAPVTIVSPRQMETEAIEAALAKLSDRVYISIDIDAFDPAYAPGTGTPEPGGLAWYPVLDILKTVCTTREIIGADIVEGIPIPGQTVTEFLAARLAYKLMVYTQIR